VTGTTEPGQPSAAWRGAKESAVLAYQRSQSGSAAGESGGQRNTAVRPEPGESAAPGWSISAVASSNRAARASAVWREQDRSDGRLGPFV
jgi:hypothetical protein